MARFTGTVEKIGDGIDVRSIADWVSKIPLEDWPPARPPYVSCEPYLLIHPAIVNDSNWHGFGEQARKFIGQIQSLGLRALEGKKLYDFKISTIVPGQFLGSHCDTMAPDAKRWAYRVHVPIVTNPKSFLIMDKAYYLNAGSAYIVNVEELHAVVNHGDTPRVHFLFEADEA